MTIVIDAAGSEIRALRQFSGDFTGQHVLEIGSGDGRLTWRYAPEAASVVGIEPDREKVARAQAVCPAELAGRVTFLPLSLSKFVASSNQSPEITVQYKGFDRAILAWSL